MIPPSITLLVTTYNRPAALQALLNSMLRQTVFPDEIVIADDGSTEETRQTIETMRPIVPIPIRHVWHPDNGFRKCEILNKALAQAAGEYIIQIDGDIVMERHFIADHRDLAESGWFVCGSRVMLSEEQTLRVESDPDTTRPKLRQGRFASWTNGLRSRIARHYLAKRYGKGKIKPIRGCNMAFWKSDLIAINGFNEEMTGWGAEDLEMGIRLKNNGVKKKRIKFGGITYHLHHPQASRSQTEKHRAIIESVIDEGRTRCENGIDKYLSGPEC